MQRALILGEKKSLKGIKILFSYHPALKAALQALLVCYSSG